MNRKVLYVLFLTGVCFAFAPAKDTLKGLWMNCKSPEECANAEPETASLLMELNDSTMVYYLMMFDGLDPLVMSFPYEVKNDTLRYTTKDSSFRIPLLFVNDSLMQWDDPEEGVQYWRKLK